MDSQEDRPTDPVSEELEPEQSSEGAESQPAGVHPKAGYPRLHPRHDEKPYRT